MRRAGFILTVLAGLLILSCDHGLDPAVAAGDPGFGGTLTIRGPWPQQDSVRQLRVVAFRNYPPEDILAEVLNGTAVFSDELPYGVREYVYELKDVELAGVFSYVAVAQNYGDDLFNDWRAVGVYTVSGDVNVPSPIDLGSGRYVGGVDITVDFYNLPPQPF